MLYSQKLIDKIENAYYSALRRSKDQNIAFDLDLNYLISIFPNDFNCPALGKKMSLKDSLNNSLIKKKRDYWPALDRVIPEFGYINSNVRWISMKANYAKSNLNPIQMNQFSEWYFSACNLKNVHSIKFKKLLLLYKELSATSRTHFNPSKLNKFNDYAYMNYQKSLKKKIRINKSTNKPYKIGDRENGMILYEFGKNISKRQGSNKGYLVEKWHSIKGKRRKDPNTGKYFGVGDIRDDGKIFSNYELTESKINTKGYFFEYWHLPEDFLKKYIKRTLVTKKINSKKNNIRYEIDYEYAVSIFPNDYICPVFNMPMRFGNQDRSSSPSLDRLDSNLGYIKGNINWISMKANWTKSDLSYDEIINLIEWYVNTAHKALELIEKESIK